MPRGHTSKGRSIAGPAFVQLHHPLLKSAAWAALSTVERAVYICLAEIYNGTNNGFLCLSVRRAAEACRINKDTAAKALHRLIELGFIECSQVGAFSYKLRHSSEFSLTWYRNDLTGAPPSKAFRDWKSPNEKHGPKSVPGRSPEPGQHGAHQ